jgi:hypothetical protein
MSARLTKLASILRGWLRSPAFSPIPLISMIFILITGLSLRIYQLGNDEFWFDEYGVLGVVNTPSLLDALHNTQRHIMAMPVDYIIAWLFARVSTDEGFMRLPAVIWGTLALIPAYFLFKRLSNQAIALTAVLFLALSPFHIQYSQELRFYSPLVFFYLSSTALFVWAIESPEKKRWIIYSLVTIAGIYTHIYVALALANGILWTFADYKKINPRARLYFARSIIFIIFALLIGLLIFGKLNPGSWPIALIDRSILDVIATGLGIYAFYPSSSPLVWGAGILYFAFALIGVFSALRASTRSKTSILFFSVLLQIAAILAADYQKEYFAAPRQFLIFLPFTLFFVAKGIFAMTGWLGNLPDLLSNNPPANQRRRLKPILAALCILTLITLTIPALANYYQGDKGNARQIATALVENWKPTTPVFILPLRNAELVDYYIRKEFGDHPILSHLYGMEWGDFLEIKEPPDKMYLVTLAIAPWLHEMKTTAPPQLLFAPQKISEYSMSVWIVQLK